MRQKKFNFILTAPTIMYDGGTGLDQAMDKAKKQEAKLMIQDLVIAQKPILLFILR